MSSDWWQHALVLALVAVAAGYVIRQVGGSFWPGGGGACHCGSKSGCAKMTEALDAAARRPPSR